MSVCCIRVARPVMAIFRKFLVHVPPQACFAVLPSLLCCCCCCCCVLLFLGCQLTIHALPRPRVTSATPRRRAPSTTTSTRWRPPARKRTPRAPERATLARGARESGGEVPADSNFFTRLAKSSMDAQRRAQRRYRYDRNSAYKSLRVTFIIARHRPHLQDTPLARVHLHDSLGAAVPLPSNEREKLQ